MKDFDPKAKVAISEIKLLEACSQGPTRETINTHELVDLLDELLLELHKETEFQFVDGRIFH